MPLGVLIPALLNSGDACLSHNDNAMGGPEWDFPYSPCRGPKPYVGTSYTMALEALTGTPETHILCNYKERSVILGI